MATDAEVAERFTYHPPPNDEIAHLHDEVRAQCGGLAIWLNNWLPGESREKSLALTAVQEAMWAANAHIAIHVSRASGV